MASIVCTMPRFGTLVGIRKPTKNESWYRRALRLTLFIALIASGIVAVGTSNIRAGILIFAVVVGGIWCFTAIIWLHTAIHEFGHVLAGLAVKYEFESIQIGGMTLAKLDRRFTLKASATPISGGLARMHPPDGKPSLRAFRVFVIGGPLASLLESVVWMDFYPRNWERVGHGTASVLTACLIGICGITAVGTFLGSLTASTANGFSSDRVQLWRSWKQPEMTIRNLAIAKIYHSVELGLLARVWNADCMEALAHPEDGSWDELYARYFRYYWYADLGDNVGAWAELCRASDLCRALGPASGEFAQILLSEQIFAAAWLRKDVDLAKSIPAMEVSEDETLKPGQSRALAALALLEGRAEDAVALVTESRESLTVLMEKRTGKCANDLMWLDEIEREAKANRLS
jgi:hypothetical protein